MEYITSAISLRKQLLILQTLRDQAIQKRDNHEVTYLSSVIERIETVMKSTRGLQLQTIH